MQQKIHQNKTKKIHQNLSKRNPRNRARPIAYPKMASNTQVFRERRLYTLAVCESFLNPV
jgi:hypothetical protein